MAQKGETMNMAPIDGDINKSVQVKMALETAGEEAVSDELYAKLHAWLSESIQQERNHWRKKMEAILQEMDHQRKAALSTQGSLQKLEDRLTGIGGDSEQPATDGRELTSGSNFDDYYNAYDEKENISSEQLIENLGAYINALKAEIITLQETINAEMSKDEQNLNSSEITDSRGTQFDPVTSRAEVPMKETLDKNADRSNEDDGIVSTISNNEASHRNIHGDPSFKSEGSLVKSEKNAGTAMNRVKDNVVVELEKTTTQCKRMEEEQSVPIRKGHGLAKSNEELRSSYKETPKSSGRSPQTDDPAGSMAVTDEKKSPSSVQGRTSVPLTTCQVWSTNEGPGSRAKRSTKESGEHTQKAIVRPFLKKGGADNTEKFSVKKLTSLAHEEKQQYERKIHGKNKEIKVLQGELEHTTGKVQKLQRVIERLYYLQRTLKNSVNISPGPEDVEEQGCKTERSHGRSKVLSESMPSLSNLPMFQPMQGDEIALWKLRIKRQNPKATKLGKNHVAQCLRCQRLFRPSDNTPVACRFHSKGQESIEKYDNHGRLVRVVYKWGCCNKTPDAPGCTHGQHM